MSNPPPRTNVKPPIDDFLATVLLRSQLKFVINVLRRPASLWQTLPPGI